MINPTDSVQQKLLKCQIEASNEFYLTNIQHNNQNCETQYISYNDQEKRERKQKFQPKVQEMKSRLDDLLKENTELYKQNQSKEFYAKKNEQLKEYIMCQQELIKQIDILDAKEKLIMKKSEDIHESMQYIENISRINNEYKNLEGFLNQVQMDNLKSTQVLNKESN